jgi:hypothetical protein
MAAKGLAREGSILTNQGNWMAIRKAANLTEPTPKSPHPAI